MTLTIDDVRAAAERIGPYAVRTPLLHSHALDELVGGRVLIKAECLQRSGSFKVRGALNRILQLSAQERERGIVAWSSGNHALAVATVSRLLGVRATIVMPADAPAPKIDGARAAGAEIVTYDRLGESREEIGGAIAHERGAVIVRPFDDPAIMAGQGTVGLELMEQAAERGLVPDAVAVAASGGGLASGVATAVHAASSAADVHVVEPAGFDDVTRSLRQGERVANEPGGSTICDALQAPSPGELTFPVLRENRVTGLVVDDDEVRRAMRVAFGTLKLVVEPGGATPLAAALAGRLPLRDRTTVLVLSGGNVDPVLFAAVVSAG
ncbi:threonine/serine dehydratase [Aeromicrobium sp. CTD01-1L150]|uniref:threonine ammonia-lyase n=1 Tax=Aeromicrobium sp. CTD01-1L150 TaxID=3341830 RepID=UPI0035BF8762